MKAIRIRLALQPAEKAVKTIVRAMIVAPAAKVVAVIADRAAMAAAIVVRVAMAEDVRPDGIDGFVN